MGQLRLEVSTQGLDEALQGISSDPFTSSGNSTYTGLRIPPVLPTYTTPDKQPRYLFTLASVTFQNGIKLLGMRQGLTIGMDANLGVAPERPIEAFVQTPTFRFVDGNVSWHLVVERQPARKQGAVATDTQSWQKLQSDSPAMLYQTFTNTNTDPSGAPIFYMQTMTAYTPPALASLEGIAGLGTFRDLRFPWYDPDVWLAFGEKGVDIDGGGRLSLHASVLQTNPATRGSPSKTGTQISMPGSFPEEGFLQDYNVTGPPILGPIYWRIMGSLIVEIPEVKVTP